MALIIGFYAEILILAKTSNFSSSYPLILMPIEKSQNDSFTNKQTIFFKFLISKSFLLLWMFMDGNMKNKITILNIAKIQFLVFPLNLDFLGM